MGKTLATVSVKEACVMPRKCIYIFSMLQIAVGTRCSVVHPVSCMWGVIIYFIEQLQVLHNIVRKTMASCYFLDDVVKP